MAIVSPPEETVMNPSLPFRPNIVWLVAEDLSPVIPAYGDSTIAPQTLERLGREGVVYDHFYSPHPVCAPARASIITGMYANHISASHMRTGPWFSDNVPDSIVTFMRQFWPEDVPPYEAVPPAEVRMFTEYLRAAGYYCTNNAKQDYQFKKTPVAWDESSNRAHWKNRSDGQPFFSVFNFNVTHESQIWAKAQDSLWVDPSLAVPVPPYLPDTEIGRRDIRRMYSNIMEMDSQIGAILGQLEADGLLDSTIVVWYTDHGGPLPRQKRLLFDSGLKVPMIIRFPGAMFAGERDDRIISFIDLGPTVLSLAGIEPPSYMEGSAFLGEYIRENEPNYSYGAADRFDEKGDRVRSVKGKRYKYIRYYDTEKPMLLDVAYRNQMPIMQELHRLNEEGNLSPEQALWFRDSKPEEELFDTWSDPHEVNDLSKDPKYADKLAELRLALDKWMEENDDTGIIMETDLRESIWPGGAQPETSMPEPSVEEGKVRLSSSTKGSSIGYRIISDTTDPSSPWQVYTEPVTLQEGDSIEFVAHRIGYRRSEIGIYPN